jgi:thioredoxin-dependent peroxiredoxin
MDPQLQPGDKAPPFSLAASGGETVSLAKFKGRTIVLYFYPKDDTTGCTTQAREFTALAQAFATAGAVVIGVSRDSVASHDKFMAKHALQLQLASDPDAAVAQRYGVWGEKMLYGKTYVGVERATFLINSKGKIVKVWRKVKVKDHAAEVLAAVNEV